MNKWTLITGASSGIGREFARVFAGHGWNVALTGRDSGRLEPLADSLQSEYRVSTRVVQADLSVPGAAAEIFDRLRATPITALVNNAGFGQRGRFDMLTIHSAMIQVNVTALVELTHLFLKPMLGRRAGHILNVASVAAFQPGPLMAIYYATKSFVFSFSCALAEELRGTGVTVTVLCPGHTKTEFHARAGIQHPAKWVPALSARRVAEAGYSAMCRGKTVVIPHPVYKLLTWISRALPATFTAQAVRKHIEG